MENSELFKRLIGSEAGFERKDPKSIQQMKPEEYLSPEIRKGVIVGWRKIY